MKKTKTALTIGGSGLALVAAAALVAVQMGGATLSGSKAQVTERPTTAQGASEINSVWGGFDNTTDDVPFVGSINDPRFEHIPNLCTGVLIRPAVLATATHCSKNYDAGWTVRFGSNNRAEGGTKVGVGDPLRVPNTDIALHKLSSPVPYAPVELAEAAPALGTKLTALGWGRTKTGESPEILQRLDDNEVRDYRDSSCEVTDIRIRTDEHRVCAVSPAGRQTDHGDSGGPLLARDGDSWKLVGILHGGDAEIGIYSGVAPRRDLLMTMAYALDRGDCTISPDDGQVSCPPSYRVVNDGGFEAWTFVYDAKGNRLCGDEHVALGENVGLDCAVSGPGPYTIVGGARGGKSAEMPWPAWATSVCMKFKGTTQVGFEFKPDC